jgi:DNA replication and repair protein RecF
MHLERLSLINFKNIAQIDMELSPSVNCFLGNNGEGKTNLLDAVHYLSYTKSNFNVQDSYNVKFDQPFFVLQGDFILNEENTSIYCGYKSGEKKQFKKNKKNYSKLADHIGLLPTVIITPNDISLVTEGSEVRRKFLDSLISQFDRGYLQNLMQYNRLMLQRSALLKQFIEVGATDLTLLDVLDGQLDSPAQKIYEVRKAFLAEFMPIFNSFYSDISSAKESVELVYQSQLNEGSFKDVVALSRTKDLRSGHNTCGLHKDDLLFTIGDRPLKRFGSQGQQKTYLIALKLATFEVIKSRKGFAPVLLLDDIFDKLDDSRIGYLLNQIAKGKVGQTFITDTSLEKVPKVLSDLGIEFKAFEIENGDVKSNLN